MSQPPVSVIIPTYNYGTTIRDAINSVLNQTYSSNKIEIIVVDDGSTDNTKENLENYLNTIIYIFQENKGKAAATNVAIKNATGKYIFNLDADDLFVENKIERVVQIFEKESEVVHVGHTAIYWDTVNQTKVIENIPDVIKERKILGINLLRYFYKNRILYGGGSTFAAKSEVLKSLSICGEVDMYIDEYLLLFSLQHGYSYILDSPLSLWRIHNKNFSIFVHNSEFYKAKKKRLKESGDAVLRSINSSNLPKDIKDLYLLKHKVNDLCYQEDFGYKSLYSIIDMWYLVFRNTVINGNDFLNIINAYKVLNRSMPTFLIKFLKTITNRA